MAICSNGRFVLTKNADNDFTFIIKENGKATPMVINGSDTFTLKLIQLNNNTTTVDFTPNLTVLDAPNGKLRLFITQAEVDSLLSERGGKEDRYYLKPVYSLILEASTLVNGVFVAKIGYIYVG